MLGAEGEIREGSPYSWTFYLEDGPLRVENYHLDGKAHEAAFRAAGFREVRWHAPRLAPAGEAAHGKEFWACLLEHPPITFIECVR